MQPAKNCLMSIIRQKSTSSDRMLSVSCSTERLGMLLPQAIRLFNSSLWAGLKLVCFFVVVDVVVLWVSVSPPPLPPIFRGSNVIGQINIILNKLFTFNILLIILCRQWLPYVWNSWTSPKTGFLPLWYFARTLLQPTVFYLFVGLSAFSFVFRKWLHTQPGWDQEIGLANAE